MDWTFVDAPEVPESIPKKKRPEEIIRRVLEAFPWGIREKNDWNFLKLLS